VRTNQEKGNKEKRASKKVIRQEKPLCGQKGKREPRKEDLKKK
jgi:hypothetical protein